MLLRLAISHGLSDREAFVEKVGTFLQEKMGQNEGDAEKYGEYLVKLLEGVNEQLLLEQLIGSKGSKRSNESLEQRVDELTKAVKELNDKVDKLAK
jgi:hypothetical protein